MFTIFCPFHSPFTALYFYQFISSTGKIKKMLKYKIQYKGKSTKHVGTGFGKIIRLDDLGQSWILK